MEGQLGEEEKIKEYGAFEEMHTDRRREMRNVSR